MVEFLEFFDSYFLFFEIFAFFIFLNPRRFYNLVWELRNILILPFLVFSVIFCPLFYFSFFFEGFYEICLFIFS